VAMVLRVNGISALPRAACGVLGYCSDVERAAAYFCRKTKCMVLASFLVAVETRSERRHRRVLGRECTAAPLYAGTPQRRVAIAHTHRLQQTQRTNH
jgi:hypothetical protein